MYTPANRVPSRALSAASGVRESIRIFDDALLTGGRGTAASFDGARIGDHLPPASQIGLSFFEAEAAKHTMRPALADDRVVTRVDITRDYHFPWDTTPNQVAAWKELPALHGLTTRMRVYHLGARVVEAAQGLQINDPRGLYLARTVTERPRMGGTDEQYRLGAWMVDAAPAQLPHQAPDIAPRPLQAPEWEAIVPVINLVAQALLRSKP